MSDEFSANASTTLPKLRPKSRPAWEKAEKRFIAASLLIIGLSCSSLLWWGRLNELPEYQIPEPIMPSPNAFDTYLQATWLMAPVVKPAVDPILDTEEITDPKEIARRYSLARRKAWLAQNAGAFAALRQGLKQQYQQPAARSFSALFPYLARYRELARRLTIESKTYQMAGQQGAAASSALDTMQFGGQVPRGGSLIAALVGLAIDTMGRRQLQKTVPHLNAAECKSAARRLEKIETARWPFAETLREEKWGMLASLPEEMKKADWAKSLASSMSGGTGEDYWMAWRIRFVGKRRVMDNYLRYMDKSIGEAVKPYAQMQNVPVPADPVNQMLAPEFSRARFNHARAQAGSALVLVSLALRAYRLEHGRYPDKLAVLAPSYLGKIPTDPFGSGESLRYQKQGATYKLWSIGPDLKDNGGAPLKQPNYGVPRKSDPNKEDLQDVSAQGDWVVQP